MNLKKVYGTLVKYLDNGRNAVFGRAYAIVQLVLSFAIYFTVSGTQISITDISFYSVILLVLMLFVGWLYSHFGLLKAEVSSRFYENPEWVEMLERLRRIESKLEEKEIK